MIESYLEFYKEANVAQRSNGVSLINELSSLLEDIDYIIHSNSSSLAPLFHLKQKTLDLKLYILREIKVYNITKEVQEAKRPTAPIAQDKLTGNKEKIVSFIKKNDKIRTKDIVEEFSLLSERTIKRTLKELTELGVLKRQEEDRAVYYSLHL